MYSVIGVLALIVLLIVNQDVIFKAKENEQIPSLKYYRLSLLGVGIYYISDFMWGIFEEFNLSTLLYIDTVLVFFLMALAVLFWAKYSVSYLANNSVLGKILVISGNIFLALTVVFLGINIFKPIVFSIDEGDEYNTFFARYIIYGLQIIIFFLTSIYTLSIGIISKNENKSRYRAIGLFSLSMAILISLQIYYPLLPLTSAGYMLGTCVLHSFIIEDEKREYRDKLEKSLDRELMQKKELGSAMKLAYTDSLTGISNKLAYLEIVELIENNITSKNISNLSIIVLDLNDLKLINDTLGHEKGDEYLVEASTLMTKFFPNSKVYRIGGDEFAIILEGDDFKNRYEIVKEFNSLMEKNIKEDVHTIIALGISDFDSTYDKSYESVFERADKAMYLRKEELKKFKKFYNSN